MVKRLILAIGIIASASFAGAFWGVSHLLQHFYIARIGERVDEQVAQSANEGRSRQPITTATSSNSTVSNSTASNSTGSNSTSIDPVGNQSADPTSVQHAAVADDTTPVEADLAPADDTRSVQLSQTAYQNLMDVDLHQTPSDESFEVRPPGIQPVDVEVNPQEVFRSEQALNFVDQTP
ncbi:MAG: hypothetical protein ACFE0I_22395 [Elainellaceae cyanobacterium]